MGRDSLLAGPLGLAVVARFCDIDDEELGDALGVDLGYVPYAPSFQEAEHAARNRPAVTAADAQKSAREARALLRGRVEAALPGLRRELAAEENAAQVLRRVGEVTEDLAFGSDWTVLDRVLGAARDELRPAAELLLASPATEWWWAPALLADQRWIADPGDVLPVRGDGEEALRAALSKQDEFAASCWWSSVLDPAVVRTTRSLAGVDAIPLACQEGAELIYGTKAIWSLEISPGARVYEIQSAADWVALTARYPRITPGARDWARWAGLSVERWSSPDWVAVRQHWDGVHVSLGGYLSAAYRALPVGSETTMLAGWNPDETLWLRRAWTERDSARRVKSVVRSCVSSRVEEVRAADEQSEL